MRPANAQATDGIRDIAGGFLDKARGQAEDGDYALARASMAAAAQIFPRHPEMEAVRDQVQSLEQDSLAAIAESPAAAGDDGSAADVEEKCAG